jgi:hypothetical protein
MVDTVDEKHTFNRFYRCGSIVIVKYFSTSLIEMCVCIYIYIQYIYIYIYIYTVQYRILQ